MQPPYFREKEAEVIARLRKGFWAHTLTVITKIKNSARKAGFLFVAVAVSVGVLLALPAQASHEGITLPPHKDRVMTSDPAKLYPRWLPAVHPIRGHVPPASAPANQNYASAQFGIDGEGNVHIAGTLMGPEIGGVLAYQNNRFETRRVSGFSPAVQIAPPGNPLEYAMAVSPAGKVYVVWVDIFNSDTPDDPDDDVYRIAYRIQETDGTWVPARTSPPQPLSGSEVPAAPQTTPASTTIRSLSAPRVAVKANGEVVIAYIETQSTFFTTGSVALTSTIRIKTSTNFTSPGTAREVSSTNYNPPPGGGPAPPPTGTNIGSLVFLRARGENAALAWTEQDAASAFVTPLEGIETTLYKQSLGGSAQQVFSDSIPGGLLPFAMALGPEGQTHFVLSTDWTSSSPTISYSATGESGSFSTVPLPTPFEYYTVIGYTLPFFLEVDSRNQPHLIFGVQFPNPQPSPETGTLSFGRGYATKPKNQPPQGTPPSPWAFQMPMTPQNEVVPELLDFLPQGFLMSENDERHLLVGGPGGGALYMRSLEPNLGLQDPFGRFSVGPNAVVDVATGNLFTNLPLFSARGKGVNVSLGLIYNSLESARNALSRGWQTNYDLLLTEHTAAHEVAVLVGVLLPPEAPMHQPVGPRILSLRLGDGHTVVFRYTADLQKYIADPEYGSFSDVTREPADIILPAEFFTMRTKFGVKYKFNSNGRLIEIKDTYSNTQTLTYDANSASMLAENSLGTDVNGVEVSEELLKTIQDTPSRPPTEFAEYNSRNQIKKIKDPAGKEYTLIYNASGQLQRVNFPAVTPPVSWSFEYWNNHDVDHLQRKGLLKTIKPPRATAANNESYAWDLFYHHDNRFAASKEPEEAHISESGGTITERAKRTVQYEDVLPSQSTDCTAEACARVKDRRDNVTTVAFEPRRSLVEGVRDPPPLSTSLRRTFYGTPGASDGYRNLEIFRDKRNNETTYTYYPTGVAEYPHVRDNLASIQRPGQGSPTTQYGTYVSHNRPASVTDPMGQTTAYGYNQAGDVTTMSYPNGDSESWGYNGDGTIASQTNGAGGVTSYAYSDPQTGLPTAITLPDHTAPSSSTYNVMGDLLTGREPASSTATSIELDNLYRPKQVTGPAGDAGRPDAVNTFNEDSDLTVARHPDGSKTLNEIIDHLGRVRRAKRLPAGPDPVLTLESEFDREGNEGKTTDPRGKVYTRKFDPLSRYLLTRIPGGPNSPPTAMGQAYNANGSVIARLVGTPSAVEATVATLTANPNATIASSPSLRVTRYTRDPRENILQVVYPDGETKEVLERDANDRVGEHKVLHGGTLFAHTIFEYDGRDRVIKERRQCLNTGTSVCPAGAGEVVTQYGYDANGNRTLVIDPEGRKTEYVYDASGRLLAIKDHNGVVISRTFYDNNDRPVRTLVPPPNPAPTGSYAQEGGMIVAERFESYTDQNEPRVRRDALGNATTFTFDILGNRTSMTDPQGGFMQWIYDGHSRMRQERRTVNDSGLGVLTTRYEYDNNGNLTQLIDPKNFTYTHEYDAANRPIKMRTPLGFEEVYTYNNLGEVAIVNKADEVFGAFTYNNMGQVIQETWTGESPTNIQRRYEGDGLIKCIADSAAGVRQKFAYDGLRRLDTSTQELGVSSCDAAGNPTFSKSIVHRYERNGNPLLVQGSGVSSIIYGWDNNNRLKNVKRDTEFFVNDITYNFDGSEKTRVLGNGVTLNRRYTARGERERITAQGPSGVVSDISQTYSPAGNVTGKTFHHLNNAQATFDYLPTLHWLKRETWSGLQGTGNGTSLYHYDPNGNRKDETTPNWTSAHTYDNNNRITGTVTTRIPAPGFIELVGTALVDSTAGGYNASVLTNNDTTNSTAPAHAWKSQAGNTGHFAGLNFSGTNLVGRVTLVIPMTGAPTGPAQAGIQRVKPQYFNAQTNTWTDALVVESANASRSLTASGWWETQPGERFITFDIIPVQTTQIRLLQDAGGGRPTSQNQMIANEIEAFLPVGFVTYTHDNRGNMTSRHAGQTHEDFFLDHNSRLKRYRRFQGSPPVAVNDTQYRVAPGSERFEKKNLLTGAREVYLHDGQDVFADFKNSLQAPNAPLTATRRYVNAPTIDSKIAWFEQEPGSPPSTHYFIPDALGSTSAIAGGNGALEKREVSDAWGNTLFTQGVIQSRYSFTQRERDQESSLMHFRNRAYDPRLGRFIQADPILANRALEHYVYVSNNPVNRIDPMGLQEHKEKDQKIWILSQKSIDPEAASRALYDALKKGFENEAQANQLVKDFYESMRQGDPKLGKPAGVSGSYLRYKFGEFTEVFVDTSEPFKGTAKYRPDVVVVIHDPKGEGGRIIVTDPYDPRGKAKNYRVEHGLKGLRDVEALKKLYKGYRVEGEQIDVSRKPFKPEPFEKFRGKFKSPGLGGAFNFVQTTSDILETTEFRLRVGRPTFEAPFGELRLEIYRKDVEDDRTPLEVTKEGAVQFFRDVKGVSEEYHRKYQWEGWPILWFTPPERPIPYRDERGTPIS